MLSVGSRPHLAANKIPWARSFKDEIDKGLCKNFMFPLGQLLLFFVRLLVNLIFSYQGTQNTGPDQSFFWINLPPPPPRTTILHFTAIKHDGIFHVVTVETSSVVHSMECVCSNMRIFYLGSMWWPELWSNSGDISWRVCSTWPGQVQLPVSNGRGRYCWQLPLLVEWHLVWLLVI